MTPDTLDTSVSRMHQPEYGPASTLPLHPIFCVKIIAGVRTVGMSESEETGTRVLVIYDGHNFGHERDQNLMSQIEYFRLKQQGIQYSMSNTSSSSPTLQWWRVEHPCAASVLKMRCQFRVFRVYFKLLECLTKFIPLSERRR